MMNFQAHESSWIGKSDMHTQLRKGVLEMCILHQLQSTEAYGYEIMKVIKEVLPDVYDGSIYAVLRRLNADEKTSVVMKQSPNGPPRKYYRITTKGRLHLDEITREWARLVAGVKRLGVVH